MEIGSNTASTTISSVSSVTGVSAVTIFPVFRSIQCLKVKPDLNGSSGRSLMVAPSAMSTRVSISCSTLSESNITNFTV